MNILNLDELVIEKTVVLNGKKRRLSSMTVQQFIESAGIDEKLKEADEKGRMLILVEQIVQFMADTTVEELTALQMPQLFALLAFVRGTDAGLDAAKAQAQEGNG